MKPSPFLITNLQSPTPTLYRDYGNGKLTLWPQNIQALDTTPTPSLSQRRIFLYWLPLAASWLLMASEMPYVNAMLARISEAERMIAAFGVVAAISITIESPVINLLSTSTAKARNRQHYLDAQAFHHSSHDCHDCLAHSDGLHAPL